MPAMFLASSSARRISWRMAQLGFAAGKTAVSAWMVSSSWSRSMVFKSTCSGCPLGLPFLLPRYWRNHKLLKNYVPSMFRSLDADETSIAGIIDLFEIETSTTTLHHKKQFECWKVPTCSNPTLTHLAKLSFQVFGASKCSACSAWCSWWLCIWRDSFLNSHEQSSKTLDSPRNTEVWQIKVKSDNTLHNLQQNWKIRPHFNILQFADPPSESLQQERLQAKCPVVLNTVTFYDYVIFHEHRQNARHFQTDIQSNHCSILQNLIEISFRNAFSLCLFSYVFRCPSPLHWATQHKSPRLVRSMRPLTMRALTWCKSSMARQLFPQP